LVEDEHVLRGLVLQFLTLEGYQVEAAADGQEAIDAYARLGPFDLIMMDLNLPHVPGVEACRQIRLMNPRQPILVCSAAILESHTEALQALGIHDTLGKPYHPAELATRLRILMAGPRQGADVDEVLRRSWRAHAHARSHVGTVTTPSALSETRTLE
jgi:DNA-binding response OmpR family regulator